MEIVISAFIALIILIAFLGLSYLVHKITDENDEDFIFSIIATLIILLIFGGFTYFTWVIIFG